MFHNLKFLNWFSPTKTTLYGLGIWIFVFLTSSLVPNASNVNFSLEVISFLILSPVFFLIGIQAGRLKLVKKSSTINVKSFSISYNQRLNLFYWLLFISFLGILFLVLDKFLIRGVSLTQSISENREELEGSSGIASILAAVLTPTCFIPLFLLYQLNLDHKKLLKLLAYFVFFFPNLIYILLGSRSGIIVLVLLFGLILFYNKRISLSLQKILFIFSAGLLLSLTMTHVFIERTKEFAPNPYHHIIYNSGVNFTVKASPTLANSILSSESTIKRYFYLTYLNFSQYYLHGAYEFAYLYHNLKGEHSCGKYTFYIYYKFFSKILGKSPEDLSSLPPRSGIYTTFFGPLFIDFWWFTLSFMFFFGFLQTRIFLKVRKNKFYWLPLHFYFIIINIFLPVFNFISGAQGLYLITSFLFFAFLCKFLCSKIIVFKHEHTIKKLQLI